jgi:hypothetical protein
LVLNPEHIAQCVLEPLRPLVIAARCVYELNRDAQLVACLAHATLHYRRDSKLPPYLAHIHASVAKLEGAAATRDAQPVQAIKGTNQLLRHTLAEVALVPVRTHVRERQDCDCSKDRRTRFGFQWGDEAIAIAVACFDVPRLPCIVPKGLAQLLDTRRERVIAYHDVAPHGGEEILLAHRMTCALDEQTHHLG